MSKIITLVSLLSPPCMSQTSWNDLGRPPVAGNEQPLIPAVHGPLYVNVPAGNSLTIRLITGNNVAIKVRLPSQSHQSQSVLVQPST